MSASRCNLEYKLVSAMHLADTAVEHNTRKVRLLELLIRHSNSCGLCLGLVPFRSHHRPLPMIHSNESLQGLILQSQLEDTRCVPQRMLSISM